MKIRDVKDPNDLIKYLRDFKGWESDYVYDFNIITHFFLALLDNLTQFGLEGEIEDIGYLFNDEQRQCLTQLAEYANRINDEQIALEDAEELAQEEAQKKALEESKKLDSEQSDSEEE